MIIKSIELKNIRSHKNTTISFPRGVVLIKGEVGSGKTSILDGLKFALFGSFQNAETLLRVGENQGEVTVILDREGSDIIFKRLLKRTKTGFSSNEITIVEDGKERKISDGEMRQYIAKMFRIKFERARDPKFFDFLFYAGQNEMRNILDMKSEERLKIIYDLFGISDFKNIIENIDVMKGIVKNEIDMRKGAIGENRETINETEKRIGEIKNEISVNSEKIKKLNEEKNKLENDLSSVKKIYDDLKEKRQEFESLNNEINKYMAELKVKKNNKNRIEQKIKSYEEDLKKKEYLEEKEKALETKKTNLDHLSKEHEDYVLKKKHVEENEKKVEEILEKQKKLKNLNEDLMNLEKKIREKESYITIKNLIEEDLEKIREKIENLNVEYRTIEKELKINKEQLSKYLDLKNEKTCPVCGRPITDDLVKHLVEEEDKKIRSAQEKLKELSVEIKNLEKEKMEKNKNLENIKKEERELNDLMIKKAKMETEVESIRMEIEKLPEIVNNVEKERIDLEKYADLDMEIKKVKEEIEVLEKYHDEYMGILGKERELNELKIELFDLSNEIESLLRKIESIENRINFIGYDENKYREMEDEYHSLDKKILEKRTLIEEYSKKDQELNENLKREMKNYEELIKKAKEKENLENFLKWMDDVFRAYVENVRISRIQRLKIEFNKKLREWMDVLLPEKVWDVDLEDDFSPIIYIEGYKISYESLSGGESTALAFSYRLALNSMIKEFHGLETNFLLLDEPTDGFSEEEISNMNRVFEKINTDQIIIVSHEKELENFADHTINIKKENNESMTIF